MCTLPLKIYWVTTVWPKWQIIIPLDVRKDFNIDIWNNYDIAIIDNIAIWLKTINEIDISKEKFIIDERWEISIWTKYQFVIPADIRKQLEINPWDNLIILWVSERWLWLIKNDNIDFLLNYLNKTLNNKN